MREISSEALSEAIQDFNRVMEIFGSKESEYAKNFRRRVLDLLSFFGTSGVLPTLTFFYAQTKGKYEEAVDAYNKGSCSGIGTDEFAYAVCLLLALKKILPGMDSKNAIGCFQRLLGMDCLKRSFILCRFLPYWQELKKLVEAVIPAGEQR